MQKMISQLAALEADQMTDNSRYSKSVSIHLQWVDHLLLCQRKSFSVHWSSTISKGHDISLGMWLYLDIFMINFQVICNNTAYDTLDLEFSMVFSLFFET